VKKEDGKTGIESKLSKRPGSSPGNRKAWEFIEETLYSHTCHL